MIFISYNLLFDRYCDGVYKKKASLFALKLLFFSLLLIGAALLLAVFSLKICRGGEGFGVFTLSQKRDGEQPEERAELPGTAVRSSFRVILDPGHGGIDGGASVNGLTEKDLNLSLSLVLRDMLRVCGAEVIMTREDDLLLDDGNPGKVKMRDLRARLAFSEQYPDALFVSIHMNKFPSERVSGLQVYYSPNNEKSAVLAETIRERVVSELCPENKRASKAADSSIFILDNIAVPAVLVECGFLSCPSEAKLLADESYQKDLSAAICTAILGFCNPD